MGFIYPYTNYHELNLDYILEEISDLKSLEDTLTNYYNELKTEFTEIESEINTINNTISDNYSDLNSKITALTDETEAALLDIRSYIDNSISECKESLTEDYTELINQLEVKVDTYYNTLLNAITLAIETCKEYTDEQVADGLKNIKIRNYFTSEETTVQEMFDILAMLHVENDATYGDIAIENVTYEDLQSYTYEFLLRYGLHQNQTYEYDANTETLFIYLEGVR